MHPVQLALLCQEGLDGPLREAMLALWARGEDPLALLPPRAERFRPALQALLRGDAPSCRRWESLTRQLEEGALRLLRPGDPEYPPALAGMSRPPDPLFIKGNAALAREEAVAIVGTRKPDEVGLDLARRFALALRDMICTVVSGGAAGIDAAAHRAAGTGRTVAVVGAGFDHPFPAHHRGLFQEIAQEGLLISEWPPWVRPEHFRFPRRNRVIAGLCRAVLVIQAPGRSGALNTAHHACEEGREVLVCPGPAGHPLYEGSHRLLREGARLVGTVEDLREDLGLLPLLWDEGGAPSPIPASAPIAAACAPAQVRDPELWHLLAEARSLDQLAEQLPLQGLPARLLTGELEGWLQALPGERWRRSSALGPSLA